MEDVFRRGRGEPREKTSKKEAGSEKTTGRQAARVEDGRSGADWHHRLLTTAVSVSAENFESERVET